MTTHDDIRQMAARLPGATEGEEGFSFYVMNKGKPKGFLWCWKERTEPKKARVPNEKIMAVMVSNLSAKEMILGSDGRKFFTEPHYNGFPAVLVRLEEIDPEEFEDLLIEAWKTKAPKELLKQYESKI